MAKTYTAVPTVTAGDVYTASAYNTYTSTNISNLIVPPAAKAVRTSTTTTLGDIAFQSVASPGFDTDSMWSAGSPSRLTINTAGIYVVTFQIRSTISSTTSTIQSMEIRKNGSAIAGRNTFMSIGAGNNLDAQLSVTANLAVNDYLQGNYTVSGGTHTLNGDELTSLAAIWIGRTS